MGLKAVSRLIASAPDYEDGTWMPTIAGTTVAGVQTYSVQSGLYTRTGNMVIAHFTLTMTAKDDATSGNILIAGLPYESADGSGFAGAVKSIANVDLNPGYSQFVIRIRPNGNDDVIVSMIGDNVASISATGADLSATTTISGLLVYRTDQ